MLKTIKVRLYPTEKQKQVIENHFDGYRFAYNLCLEYKSTLWRDYKKNVSGIDMQNELTSIRSELFWLSRCKAECITVAGINIEESFKKMRKRKKFPKFKSKRGIQAFSVRQSIVCKNKKLSFYGNKIKFKTSEHYHNMLSAHRIRRCNFKRDLSGCYWATLLIDTQETYELPETTNSIGIDLGLKDLIITSEGETFENKKYLQSAYYKLRRLQRKHAKTKKRGKNREKLRIKIARLNRKIRNKKEHYYHQITNQLLRENQTIVIETLAVKNMMQNQKLARSISDASWGMLVRLLEYKGNWYGRDIIRISQWSPTSKTCSGCGYKKEELKLSERIFNCESCGLSIDRDLNAAINIKTTGLKIPEVPAEDSDIS